MRDHTKLRAFELADEVAILIYQATKKISKEETLDGTETAALLIWEINPTSSKDVQEKARANIFVFLKLLLGVLIGSLRKT